MLGNAGQGGEDVDIGHLKWELKMHNRKVVKTLRVVKSECGGGYKGGHLEELTQRYQKGCQTSFLQRLDNQEKNRNQIEGLHEQ